MIAAVCASLPRLRVNHIRTLGQGVLATVLRLIGWLVVNALVSLGAPLVLAFTIAGFSVNGTMHQLGNLAGRYLAAGPERQGQFDVILVWITLGCFAGVGFFRRHSLKRLIFQESGRDRWVQVD